MKKLLFLLMATACSLSSQAEDVLQVIPFTASPGDNGWTDTKYFQISLTNENCIVNASRFHLYLPKGMDLDTSYDEGDEQYAIVCDEANTRFQKKSGPQTKKTQHTAAYAKSGEDDEYVHYTVILSQGINTIPIQGTSGAIMNVYYTVSSSMSEGIYPIYIKNVELTNTVAETNYTYPSSTSYVQVGIPSSGACLNLEGIVPSFVTSDLPEDGQVDFSGVTEIYGSCSKEVPAWYIRENAAKWGTICLPFDVASNDKVKYYGVKSISDEAITLSAMTNVPAGTPALYYQVDSEGGSGCNLLFRGNGAISSTVQTNANLIGTMIETKVEGDDAAKSYYLKGNKFYKGNESFTVKAFRAYMQAEQSEAKVLNIEIEDATGIKNITDQLTEDDIYNLTGVKMAKAKRGVNIINGKKVLVK